MTRALAIAVHDASSGFNVATWTAIVKRLGIEFDVKTFKDYSTGRLQRLDMLASLGGSMLLGLIAEGLFREDLEMRVSGYNHHGYDKWFLEGIPKAEDGDADLLATTAAPADASLDIGVIKSITGAEPKDVKKHLKDATIEELQAALAELESRSGATFKTKAVTAELARRAKAEAGTTQKVCAKCNLTCHIGGLLENGYDAALWEVLLNHTLRAKTGKTKGALVTPHGAFYCSKCAPKVRMCRECGCTDGVVKGCLERTGKLCTWVGKDLCSACVSATRTPDATDLDQEDKCAECGADVMDVHDGAGGMVQVDITSGEIHQCTGRPGD